MLLDRARHLWCTLAAAPVKFPPTRATVVVSPHSRLGPPGWTGVVTLGPSAIATVPAAGLKAAVEAALRHLPAADMTDPRRLRATLPIAEMLGPAALAYAEERRSSDRRAFKAPPNEPGRAFQAAPDDPGPAFEVPPNEPGPAVQAAPDDPGSAFQGPPNNPGPAFVGAPNNPGPAFQATPNDPGSVFEMAPALAEVSPGDPGLPALLAAVPPDDPGLAALLAEVPPDNAGESGLDEITSSAFVAHLDGRVIAAAGWRRWPTGVAHLSVLTAEDHRGRGLGRAVAGAAVADALAAGLLPQWRARLLASRRVAQALGFRELGSQLSFHLPG